MHKLQCSQTLFANLDALTFISNAFTFDNLDLFGFASASFFL